MPPIEHSIALLEGLATGKHPTLVDHDTVIDHRNKKNKVLSSIQLRDVEEALAAGNKSKASRLLRYIVENEPDHDAAWMKLAELSDCPLEQIYYYKKVLHLKPLHAGVILRLESCYFEAGKQAVEAQQTSQARLYFQELLQLNPLHEDARLMLARIAETAEEAYRYYEDLLKLAPLHVPGLDEYCHARSDAALADFEQGNMEEGHKHLQVILRHKPDDLNTLLLQAEYASHAEQAIQLLEQVLKMHPVNSRVKELLAKWGQKMVACHLCYHENMPKLELCFRCRAPLAINNILAILEQADIDPWHLQRAEERYRQQAMRQPTPRHYFNYGIALLYSKKLDAAINVFQSAVEKWPDLSELQPYLDKLQAIKKTRAPYESYSSPVVLVIDDSPAVKKGIDQVLRQAGYVVMLSSNSGEAFDRIKTCCVPSLIIVDELLPEIDGFHIVKLLRNTKSTQQVPILMLTRQSGFFLKMKATWKGVNEYLAKPLAPDKLLAAVQKLCPVQT